MSSFPPVVGGDALVVDDQRYCQAPIGPFLHYCALIGPELHSDVTPALLCHKEPAQGTQTPLQGAFLAFHWFFMT